MSKEHSTQDIASLGELRWHCRRAKLELDFILERYLDQHFAASSAEEQRDFVALLDRDDEDIFDWVVRRVEPPTPGFGALVKKIREL